jgi:hypothetical protein
MLVPSPFGVAFGDSPCYRDGATVIDYTYAENSELKRESSGIQSNGYLSSLPSAYHPAHQEGKTVLYLYINSLVSPFVFAVVAPFSQSLAHGVFLNLKKRSQEEHDCC